MSIIYHVTTASQWAAAVASHRYEAPSLATEGFIHCSTAEQVSGVLHRYFKGQNDLIKLTIETNRLEPALRFELSPSVNEEFPHVFGPINLDAVISVENI